MFNVELVQQMIEDNNKNKSTVLGKISNGKVLFDGETVESNKTYKKLNNITLNNGDRVLLINIGGTFVILGKIT